MAIICNLITYIQCRVFQRCLIHFYFYMFFATPLPLAVTSSSYLCVAPVCRDTLGEDPGACNHHIRIKTIAIAIYL